MTDDSSERLRLIRQLNDGITQNALSEITGIPIHKIKSMETGKTKISVETASILEEKFNLSFKWILTGEGEKFNRNQNFQAAITESQPPIHMSSNAKLHTDENGIHIPQWEHPDPEQYHYVPMAEATLNAGGGSFVLSEDTTGKYYAFRKNFLKWIASSPKNLILMKVTGDSMEPKIEDGDTVMIDVGKRQLQNGCIYALGYDDVIVIKEIEKLPGDRVCIISRNRKGYPPYEANLSDIRIIGQVIWGDRTFVK